MLTTFANLDYLKDGDYEPTKENFPACKILFTDDSVDADTLTATELMSGAIFDMSADGVTTVNKAPVSGDISFSASANILGFYKGGTSDITDSLIRIGLSTGDHIAFNAATGADPLWNVKGNINVDHDSTPTTGELSAPLYSGVRVVVSDDLIGFDNDGANNIQQDLAGVPVGIPGYIGANLGNAITLDGMSSAQFDGFAVFSFASGIIPADLKEGLQWMAANWQNGNYWLYPPWKGLL